MVLLRQQKTHPKPIHNYRKVNKEQTYNKVIQNYIIAKLTYSDLVILRGEVFFDVTLFKFPVKAKDYIKVS